MPLKQCEKDGKFGYSWGNGPCLIGKDAKKKAIKMGLAIEGPEKFKQIMKSEGYSEYATEYMIIEANRITDNE